MRTRLKTRSSAKQIEARNSLDGMVYNIEKMLKDARRKSAGRRQDRSRSGAGRCQEDTRRLAVNVGVEVRERKAHPRQPQTGRGHVQGQLFANGPGRRTRLLGRHPPASRRKTKASSTPSTSTSTTRSKAPYSSGCPRPGSPRLGPCPWGEDPSHLGTWESTNWKSRGGRFPIVHPSFL